MAAMLNWINLNLDKHIVTIEDPIEYTFQDEKSLFQQREIGLDVPSFDLAIKSVLAATERVTVSVLDEVDTGVGGAVADVVGRLIKDLSSHRQVLCITHLPQVAAHASRHLRIEKHLLGGRVQSTVEVLGSLDARSDELARMLSGVEVSKEARAAAQVLIAGAARAESPRSPRRKRDVRAARERRTA
jgi:DNA repair protein RecN (Recombination protein N)